MARIRPDKEKRHRQKHGRAEKSKKPLTKPPFTSII
jgi:hypothetical protein